MLSASTLQTMIDGKQINRYDVSSFLELVLSVILDGHLQSPHENVFQKHI